MFVYMFFLYDFVYCISPQRVSWGSLGYPSFFPKEIIYSMYYFNIISNDKLIFIPNGLKLKCNNSSVSCDSLESN